MFGALWLNIFISLAWSIIQLDGSNFISLLFFHLMFHDNLSVFFLLFILFR